MICFMIANLLWRVINSFLCCAIFYHLSFILATNMEHKDEIECPAFFKQRSFVPNEYSALNNPPALLWTFPGSGNTWARMIIESGTGFFSGALYDDSSLRTVFPGEGKCGPNVVIVKSHHKIEEIRQFSNNCHIKPFNRAIVIIRDPFDAIFAEYQRLWLTENKRRDDSHFGKISASQFKIDHFKQKLPELCRWYHRLESHDYPIFLSDHGANSILFIKFENLTHPSSSESFFQIIEKMLNFTMKNFNPSIYSNRLSRLDCVLHTANRSDIKRESNSSAEVVITRDFVYSNHPQIVCQIWSLVGMDAEKHGYKPFGGISC